MRWKIWAITLLCILLPAGSAAWGQEDSPGLLFNETESKQLGENLRDLKTLRSVVEDQKTIIANLQQQLKEKDGAIAQYKDAVDAQKMAIALSDDREKRRQEIENEYKDILLQTKSLIADQREAMKNMMDENKSLHRELFWSRLLGPLGIIAGVFTGGMLH